MNQSLADAAITDPVLRERGAREQPYLTEVREQLANRVAWVPWYPEPPVGFAQLLQFARGSRQPALAPVAS